MKNSNQEISKARTYAVDITNYGADTTSDSYHPDEWEETKTFYFSSLEDAKLFAELKSQDPAIVGKPARDDFHDSRGWSYSEPYEIARDRQDIKNLISQYRNEKSLPGFESERGRSFVKICEEKGLAPGDFIPEGKNIDEIPLGHWDEICKGIQSVGLGAKKMLEPGFDLNQLKAIRNGLENGADMSSVTPKHDAVMIEVMTRSSLDPQTYSKEAVFFITGEYITAHPDSWENHQYETDTALSLIEQGADPHILMEYADRGLADLMVNCYKAGVSNEELNKMLTEETITPEMLHSAQKKAIYRKYGFSDIDTREKLEQIFRKHDSARTGLTLLGGKFVQQEYNSYLESVLEVCKAIDDRYDMSTKQGIALLEDILQMFDVNTIYKIPSPENISKKAQEIRDGAFEPDKHPKHTSTWEELIADARERHTSRTRSRDKDQRSKSDDLTR